MEESNNDNKKLRNNFRLEDVPLTEDTTCGFGPFRGPFLQKCANKKVYIVLYGVIGLWQSASWSYFNGTISTMEKRFKIPSRTTGLIETGGDISIFFSSIFLTFWVGGGHRPRWLAFGLLTMVIKMLLTALPHFIYGPGEDALKLTMEYGTGENITIFDQAGHEKRFLCKGGEVCVDDIGSVAQPLILFIAQIIGGIGGSLFYTLGISYIDDNITKSETPFFISLSFCIRMIGPTIGFAIASTCLKYFIDPYLTPKVTADDPRWLGAWWIGWIVIATPVLILLFPLALFPKALPEAAASRVQNDEEAVEIRPSIKELISTMKRLFTNKIFLYNNFATVFYCLGEDPFWVYLAKYVETQYKQTASAANFITGTVGLGSTAFGIILSGYIISRYKPTARTLAAWNVSIGVLTVCGVISYMFISCETDSFKSDWQDVERTNYARECRADCGCEFVSFSPVCSEDKVTYISPCHAGCRSQFIENGTTIYMDCACVGNGSTPGTASKGMCPVDCTKPMYIFLTVLTILKLAGAAGVASNFLVGVRCIEEKDKSVSMGISMTFLSVLAFAPAPVLYGYILDTTCLVWGKTCTGKGNCWVYDSKHLAYAISIPAASFITLGTLFDWKVWYHSKDLKIFD